KTNAEEQDTIRFKAQWNAIEVEQRVHEKPCAHQQSSGECNLPDHESLVQPEFMTMSSGTSRIPESGLGSNSHSLPGRRHSEENAGRERDCQSEQKHAPVELYLHQFLPRRIHQQSWENIAARIAEQQTRCAAKAGKQQT